LSLRAQNNFVQEVNELSILVMKQREFSDESFRQRASDAGVRFTAIVIATLVLVLWLPHLDSPKNENDPAPTMAAAPEPPEKVGVKLRRGETLASVLTRFGVKPPSAHALIDKVRPFVNPKKIRAGHDVHVVLNREDKTVEGIEFVIEDSLVRVKSTAEGWSAERQEIPFARETRVIRGTITDSLYQSGIDAGLTPQEIAELAKVFEYEIDFLSDIRRDDTFAVIVEENRYRDGRRGLRKIVAAELEVGAEIFSAFYHVGKNGGGSYYDSEGRAVRRAFLRAPLSYARVSSPFSTGRLHPISRSLAPHQAIDYAAPAGTPAVAIGRGRVEFVGWRNGYGNTVEIRHSAGYMSRYAHFSRFADGIRRGKSVETGEVVGYVGQTGHATGPHLHFEFLHGEQKLNFLSLRVPTTEKLTGDDLLRFKQLRDQRYALLRREENRIAGT
jgi:murein DD-endopeptidase MepM/ murein hydrolase activator NlpD